MAESDEAVEAVTEDQQRVENEAQERTRSCWEEIQAVLRKHSCRLVGSIEEPAEPVGRWGDCVQLRAGIRVIPLVKQ